MDNQQILTKVLIILVPTILLAGTVGNILSIVAVANRTSRKSSFTTYIGALALADMLVLYSNLLPGWLYNVTGIDIEATSHALCKMIIFLSTLSRHHSSWLVAVLTVERTFCVFLPHKTRALCKTRTGYVVIGASLLLLFALNSHMFYGFHVLTTMNGTECAFIDKNYGRFIMYYYTWIDFGVYFLVPVGVIVVANSATLTKVYKTNKLLSGSIASDSNRVKRTRHLLRITLLVSSVFILCLSPASVYHVLWPYIHGTDDAHAQTTGTDRIIWTALYYWEMINHAVNFFLYVLSGERFRNNLKHAFCKTSTETYME